MTNFLSYLVCLSLFLGACGQDSSQDTAYTAADSITLDTVPVSNRASGSTYAANVTTTGMASYYSDRLHGRPTASGEKYDTAAFTAAHRSLPFGSIVKVTRISTGKTIEVRINDRGPHTQKRIIDLSKAAAKSLGIYNKGIARVQLEVLSKVTPN